MSRFVHHDYRDACTPLRHLVILTDARGWPGTVLEVNEWCREQFGPPFDSENMPGEGDRWSQRFESWVFCRDTDVFAFKIRWF